MRMRPILSLRPIRCDLAVLCQAKIRATFAMQGREQAGILRTVIEVRKKKEKRDFSLRKPTRLREQTCRLAAFEMTVWR